MNYRDAYERYMRDNAFRALVDAMVNQAMTLQMSPGELREAAVFAEGMAYEKMRIIQMREGITFKFSESDEPYTGQKVKGQK